MLFSHCDMYSFKVLPEQLRGRVTHTHFHLTLNAAQRGNKAQLSDASLSKISRSEARQVVYKSDVCEVTFTSEGFGAAFEDEGRFLSVRG